MNCLEGYITATTAIVSLDDNGPPSIYSLTNRELISDNVIASTSVTVRETETSPASVTITNDMVSFSNSEEGTSGAANSSTNGFSLTSASGIAITANVDSDVRLSGESVIANGNVTIEGDCNIQGNTSISGNIFQREVSVPVIWNGPIVPGVPGRCYFSGIGNVVFVSFIFPNGTMINQKSYLTLPPGTVPECFRPSRPQTFFYMTASRKIGFVANDGSITVSSREVMDDFSGGGRITLGNDICTYNM